MTNDRAVNYVCSAVISPWPIVRLNGISLQKLSLSPTSGTDVVGTAIMA
jgi:hypothetical protein